MADGLYLELETAVDNSISFYVCACFRLGHLDIIQILFHIVISSFYVLFFTELGVKRLWCLCLGSCVGLVSLFFIDSDTDGCWVKCFTLINSIINVKLIYDNISSHLCVFIFLLMLFRQISYYRASHKLSQGSVINLL